MAEVGSRAAGALRRWIARPSRCGSCETKQIASSASQQSGDNKNTLASHNNFTRENENVDNNKRHAHRQARHHRKFVSWEDEPPRSGAHDVHFVHSLWKSSPCESPNHSMSLAVSRQVTVQPSVPTSSPRRYHITPTQKNR